MSVLVCLSVVINTLKLWEERVYFYLHCQVSLSLRELWAGTQAGIQEETMEESCLLARSYPMFTRLSVSLAWGWCCPQQAGSSFHISHQSRQSLTGMAIGQFALGNPSLGPIQMILRCVKLTAEFNYDNRVREILSFP